VNSCSRWSWCLAVASSRWAARAGRNSMLVWKKVQVSQMDSNAQSSSGAGAPAVAEHAVVLAAQPGHLRAELGRGPALIGS
jgi:hypothetical protein